MDADGAPQTNITNTPALDASSDWGNKTPILVTNTNDSGAGSLRQAILDANAAAGADTINFDIPDAPNVSRDEVKTISPGSELPDITDPVTIDGYTQLGASENTKAQGNDAVLLVELDGTSAGSNAMRLDIRASDSVVRGLMINRFRGNISVFGSGTSGVRIMGNFIGTAPSGMAPANGVGPAGGVFISSTGTGNIVGGT